MKLSTTVILSALALVSFAGCASSSVSANGDRPVDAGEQGDALRVVDHFSLPCKSVRSMLLFHSNTFVAMVDGCKSGVVQNGLYTRKYDNAGRAVQKTNLIFPELLHETPLDANNQRRTWIDDEGGLNWLAPSGKLENCLAYSRMANPFSAKDFTGRSVSCLKDPASLGAELPNSAGFVRLKSGDLFHHAGKRGVLFRKAGDVYEAVRALDPDVAHTPGPLSEHFNNIWGCAEGTPGQLMCQARFGSSNSAFYTKLGNDQTGLAIYDMDANRIRASYQRGTVVFDRLVASPKGLLVSAANDGPRQLAWTAIDSTGRLVHDDKTDVRGVIPINRGPEWGYGTPAFSPDGAWLYVIRSDKLLDIFSTEPFMRRATLSTTQLGIRQIGFVAVDNTNGHVAICGDKDCTVIQGWK